jgi:hypothetical protein
MNVVIWIRRDPDMGISEPATLTTDHAASSYGLPVVVTRDGAALGPADLDTVNSSSRIRSSRGAQRRLGTGSPAELKCRFESTICPGLTTAELRRASRRILRKVWK